MAEPLSKQYDPQQVQQQIEALWEGAGAFHAAADPQRRPYAIVIPPPNVTAALHMGHALNNTLQDILIRWRRMAGDNAVWIPGTDHAGIATQTVVEKRLMQTEGKRRVDFSRDQFVEKVQDWKDEYERRITDQLKRMGCSCDYDRQRFTMDEVCADAVREAFFRLFRDGLIYRGKRLVNWDPVTQTALADDEVEMRTVDGHFWYMRYPIVERDGAADGTGDSKAHGLRPVGSAGAFRDTGEFATVATTRPETMLGDTAVAVNPEDPQRAHLIGKHVRLPIVNRILPIIGDEYVVMPDPDAEDAMRRYASGFLKVTPAHDPNDYALGEKHSETIAAECSAGQVMINVMAPDASISSEHGWPQGELDEQRTDPFLRELFGRDRYEARRAIVDWFRANELLGEVLDYSHVVGHSYRSHVPIEPYLSDQWYVAVTEPTDQLPGEGETWGETGIPLNSLAGAALQAMSQAEAEGGGDAQPVPDWTQLAAERDAQQATTGDGAPLRPGTDRWQHQLNFYPQRYAKTFQQWHENLRDWCISRQLWWGHRIPVWSFEPEEPPHTDPDFQSAYENPEAYAADLKKRLAKCAPDADVDADIYVYVDVDSDVESFFICARTEVAAQALNDLVEVIRERQQQSNGGDKVSESAFKWASEERHAAAIEASFLVAYIERDPDVLDTWFSSALWPISTLGWPDPSAHPEAFSGDPSPDAALYQWNPSSTLCTAREIITLWVSRMVMFNLYFRGCLPFYDVFIHAMIQDGVGQKMSKSLGNGVDPLDIVRGHGADALRFTLAAMTTETQDVKMPVDVVCPHTGKEFDPATITTDQGYTVAAPVQTCPDDPNKKMVTGYGVASGEAEPSDQMPLARNTSPKFDYGRNFANKLWNAGRFLLSHFENGNLPTEADDEHAPVGGAPSALSLPDRWVLSRLAATAENVEYALRTYRFNEYARQLYEFFWRDLCDWYLEAIKPVARENSDAGQAARSTLAACFDTALRMLHPAMPYVTEKLYQRLNETVAHRGIDGVDLPPAELCIHATWPTVASARLRDRDVERRFELIREAVSAVRNVRNEYNVGPRQLLTARIRAPQEEAATLNGSSELLKTLAGAHLAEAGPGVEPGADAATAVFADVELYVDGLIDPDAERKRLSKRIEELRKNRDALQGRLNNPGYVQKAPEHLVRQTRDDLAEVEREIETIESKLNALA